MGRRDEPACGGPDTADTGAEKDWQEAFLESLRKDATVKDAAKAAGVSRAHVYEVRKEDRAFALAWDAAGEECVESVESKLFERASTGASDTAIIFFLKNRKPQVYGDRLKFEEREQIRKETREALLAELSAEMRELTPAARKRVMAAIPAADTGS